jgi:thiamine pyrophosphate-dependent acetolactate synthase large subunit-like protein
MLACLPLPGAASSMSDNPPINRSRRHLLQLTGIAGAGLAVAGVVTAQNRMREWNALLGKVASTRRTPLRPQMVVRELSDALSADAIISLDCGANTHFAARILQLRENQRLTGTGLLATMGPGLSYAIAAQLAFPQRQSVGRIEGLM